MTELLTPKRLVIKVFICLVILIAAIASCTLAGKIELPEGPRNLSLKNVLSGKGQNPGDNIDYEIFLIRLRRVLLAAIVGAALAGSGVVLQAILRNPLADPYILGISSGAGLGAIIAILSGITWNFWARSPIAIFAFIGAMGTVWLVWTIGHFAGKSQVTALLLAGVVVNAFFSAVIMFLTSIAKSDQLRNIIYWLMGNISDEMSSILFLGSICIIGGIICLFLLSNKLNLITLGESEARSLGISTEKARLLSFALTAFITAIAVSLSGLIGFVGLIVPHAVRLIFGPDHRQLLPLSAIIGGIFLVCADTIARTIFRQEQLPVGVITAIAGGPFFLILLARYTRKVSWLK